MKDASKLFIGMHDFKAFSDKSPDDKSTKCLVESLEVTEDSNKIYIRIKASHFLWKMVRRIVGTLVEVGRGKMKNEEISELLSSLPHKKTAGGFRSPAASGINTRTGGGVKTIAEFTAPPSGLFLEKIVY